MSKTKGNPDVRLAFRFIRMRVIAEANALPMPTWIDFDEFDMFDSVVQGSVTRTGYTPDGNSKISRVITFILGEDVVATVMLTGVQDPWGTASWTINRVIYREFWDPDTGAGGATFDFDVDIFSDGFTSRRAVLADA